MKKLLKYHQRLVNEKGLPPSKLMLKHAINEQLMCEIFSYILKSDLNMHMKTDHFVKCCMCKLTFQNRLKLIDHMNLTHKEIKNSFKDIGEQLLKKISQEINSDGPLPECPKCDFFFEVIEEVHEHVPEIFCKGCDSCIKSAYPKSDWPLPEEDQCLAHTWILNYIF